MSLIVWIGIFIGWQLLCLAGLWGALRLVRGGAPRRFPRPARIPREFATGEWHEAPR